MYEPMDYCRFCDDDGGIFSISCLDITTLFTPSSETFDVLLVLETVIHGILS